MLNRQSITEPEQDCSGSQEGNLEGLLGSYSSIAGWRQRDRLAAIASAGPRSSKQPAPVVGIRSVRRRLGGTGVGELLARHDEGWSIAALAREFGISRRSTRQLLRADGRQLQNVAPVTDAESQRIEVLYVVDRLSIARIAEQLALPVAAVRRTLRHRSVVMRPRGRRTHSLPFDSTEPEGTRLVGRS